MILTPSRALRAFWATATRTSYRTPSSLRDSREGQRLEAMQTPYSLRKQSAVDDPGNSNQRLARRSGVAGTL